MKKCTKKTLVNIIKKTEIMMLVKKSTKLNGI